MARPTLAETDIPEEFRQYQPHALGFEPRDLRDLKASAVEATAEILPDRVMLPKLTPVRDQGAIGSCVAHAFTAMQENYEYRTRGATPILSPEHLYWTARTYEGTQTVDAGTYVRSAAKAARRWGVPPEDLWTYDGYDTWKMRQQPEYRARFQAAFHKPARYVALETIQQMESSIAQGFGFCLIFFLTEGLYQNAYTGDVPIPKENEGTRGAHACFFDGYDRATRRFRFKNSWGTRFGDSGYGTLPYEFFIEGDPVRTWANDAWSLRR
jgi:C1A family cysteine protease